MSDRRAPGRSAVPPLQRDRSTILSPPCPVHGGEAAEGDESPQRKVFDAYHLRKTIARIESRMLSIPQALAVEGKQESQKPIQALSRQAATDPPTAVPQGRRSTVEILLPDVNVLQSPQSDQQRAVTQPTSLKVEGSAQADRPKVQPDALHSRPLAVIQLPSDNILDGAKERAPTCPRRALKHDHVGVRAGIKHAMWASTHHEVVPTLCGELIRTLVKNVHGATFFFGPKPADFHGVSSGN